MNTKRTLKWGLVTAAAVSAAVAAMAGCELLVDFDRSKIPSEGGTEDVTMLPDGPAGEGGKDVTTDAPSEASTGDAPAETAADAPSDTTTSDGGMEAQPEAGPEPMPEAGPDAGPDGGDGATE